MHFIYLLHTKYNWAVYEEIYIILHQMYSIVDLENFSLHTLLYLITYLHLIIVVVLKSQPIVPESHPRPYWFTTLLINFQPKTQV